MYNDKIILYLDLKKSRQIKDRFDVKQKLEETLAQLNKKYKKNLYAPIGSIKGIDELEIILDNASLIVDVLYDFLYLMERQPYRIVLVEGAIEIESDRVNEVDGSVFHNINPMLEYSKKNNFYFLAKTKSMQLNGLLNSSMNMLLEYWYSLTDSQFKVYSGTKEEKNQMKIADENGWTQQYVSKVFNSIKGKLYIWIEKQINLSLINYNGK